MSPVLVFSYEAFRSSDFVHMCCPRDRLPPSENRGGWDTHCLELSTRSNGKDVSYSGKHEPTVCRTQPKSSSLLEHCVLRGVYFIAPPEAKLCRGANTRSGETGPPLHKQAFAASGISCSSPRGL
jgi:hypothetical protein